MTTSSSSISPTNPTNKFSLQTLSGLAILGMLVTSIWEFGGFRNNEQLFYYLAAKGGNYQLLTVVSALFERKMMALFAIVFGAAIGLFMKKKELPAPISAADAFIRNQLWLILFGLLNAFIFLWPNDLLYHLGIVGILVFAFWRLSIRGLLIAAFCCLLIYSGKNYWATQEDKADYKKYEAVMAIEKKFSDDSISRAKKDSLNKPSDTTKLKKFLTAKKMADSLAKKKDTLTSKQAEEKEKWLGIVKSLQYDSSKTVADNKALRAGYSKAWFYLKGRAQNKESTWLYSLGVWYLGGMMFVGMALLSLGFFESRLAKNQYLLIALGTLAAGFLLSWLRIGQTHTSLLNYADFLKSHLFSSGQFYAVEDLFIAIGYISLVLYLLQTKFLQWLWLSFSAIGRMAITNYILQVVACSILFYGYGLGFYGRFTQWKLYFLVAEFSLVQIVFSVLWLRSFQKGPVEWLLHGLVYHKWNNKKYEAVGS
jgi:uncharacterized protein